VQYVDRLTREQLRVEYPEMQEYHRDFVHVDIVDDGEQLARIADGSLDFVVANHMLEHCENPLGTMRNHLRKLRRGGVLYYAIPDKTRTFDIDRPLTSFEHLVQDDQHGPQATREQHYLEFVRCVAPYTWIGEKVKNDADAVAEAKRQMDSNFSIHFHVWDPPSFSDFLSQARAYLDDRFEVKCVVRNGSEIIAVLEARGTTR
jgi:predicted SAM-dependent methyltransferase